MTPSCASMSSSRKRRSSSSRGRRHPASALKRTTATGRRARPDRRRGFATTRKNDRTTNMAMSMLRILSLTLLALTSACSSDTPIMGDYVIYDLGGSNQILMGNSGLTSVSDVTAYAVTGRFIILETKGCKYGFVDTATGKATSPPQSSAVYPTIASHIMRYGKKVLMTSCLRN